MPAAGRIGPLLAVALVLPLTGARAAPTAEFSNPTPIVIPGVSSSIDPGPAKPYPSPITVAGVGKVHRVTVTIKGLTHRGPSEVEVLLVGPPPASKKVILMAYVARGPAEAKNLTYTFDDAAPSKLPAKGDPPPSGTYRPSSYRNHADDPKFGPPAPKPPYQGLLSAFKGTEGSGVWKLYVWDTLGSYDGRLDGGWTLQLNGSGGSSGPVPTCGGRKATITGKGTIGGSIHPDVIVGSDGADVIHGYDSDDLICGGGGDDRIFGETGDDRLLGGDGKDTMQGAAGDDEIAGEGWADTLSGGAGRDQIAGGTGNDQIKGGTGDDKIAGGEGKDTITGGSGADSVDGGAASDSCQAPTTAGDALIRCETLF